MADDQEKTEALPILKKKEQVPFSTLGTMPLKKAF
jgi:hypothetical protein